MAVSLSSTLNSLLLNPYVQQNAAQGSVARIPTDPIRPGATITARYTVEEDGALALRDVDVVEQIANSTSEQSQQKKQQAAEQQARQQYSFSDLAKPKPNLSPTDELELFARFAGVSSNDPLRLAAPKASDEQANEPGITIFDADGNEVTNATANLASQRQQKVAFLYARNADVTYNVNPVFSEAA